MMRAVVQTAVCVLLLGGLAWIGIADEGDGAGFLLGIRTDAELSAEQQAAVVACLAEKPRWRIRAHATFLRIAKEAADSVLGEHRPAKMGSATVIPEKLAQRLIASTRARGPIGPEPLPPLIVGHGVTGRLTAGGVHPYVMDYDDEKARALGGGSPLFGQLEDGVRLDLTPQRTDQGMKLAVGLAWAEVVRPVPIFEAGSTARTVRIELPEMGLVELRNEVELPSSGGFVLAGRGFAWDQETVRVVVLEIRPNGR